MAGELEGELKRRKRAEVNSLEALLRQGAAGFTDLGLAPMIDVGGFRVPGVPNAVVALPALVELGLNFGVGQFEDVLELEEGAMGRLDFFTDLLVRGITEGEALTGTGPPRTTAENAFRVIPSALVPLPVRGAGFVGQAARSGKDVFRGSPGTFIPGTQFGRSTPISGGENVARAASEVLLPGVQSRTVPGMLLSTLPELAATEIISEAVDPAFKSEFLTLQEQSVVSPEQGPFVMSTLAEEDKELSEFLGQPLLVSPEGRPLQEVPDVDEDMSLEIAGGIAAVLALVGTRAAMRVARARTAATERTSAQELAGTREPTEGVQTETRRTRTGSLRGPISDRMTRVETQLVDRDAPLFNALREGGVDADTFDLFRARVLTTQSTQALSARLIDAARTGQLPNSAIRAPRLGAHLETLGRLSPQQQALYNDGLIARTRLDDLNIRGTDMWGEPSNVRSKSRQDLVDIVRRAEDDPIVRTLMNEANDFYQSMADYMLEAGIITPDRRADWLANNAHYNPLTQAFDHQSRFMDMFAATEPQAAGELRFLRKRADDLVEGVQPGDAAEPTGVHAAYLAQSVRYTENNRMRREFIDLALESDITDANNNALAERVGKRGTDTLVIKRNGVTEYYKVRDVAVRNALFFRPQHVAGWGMNTMRKFGQDLTTGYFRPDFVPVSLMYEMQTALPLVRTGRALGPLDEALKRTVDVTLSDVGLPDPSVVVSPVTGSFRAAYGEFTFALAQSLDRQLRYGGQLDRRGLLEGAMGGLARVVGDENIGALSKVMMEAYERSTARLFQQYGGGNNIFIENVMTGKLPQVVSDIAPRWVRQQSTNFLTQFAADSWSRAYVTMMSAMHNSIRLQHAAGNIKRRPLQVVSDPDEITRVMTDTRTLTGDVTRIGGDPTTRIGEFGQKFISQSLYANHFVQVLAQHGRAIRSNPKRYMLTKVLMLGGTAAFLMEQFRNDPKAMNSYWNEMTVEQRGMMLPIYEDGGIIGLLMIAPEDRLLWSPFIEGIGTTFGYKAGSNPPPDITDLREVLDIALGAEFTEQDMAEIGLGFTSQFASSVLPDPVGPMARTAVQAVTGAEFPNLAVEGMSAITGLDLGGSGGRFRSMEPRPNRLEIRADAEVIERARMIVDGLMVGSARMVIDSANMFVRSLDVNQDLYNSFDNAARAFLGPIREPTRAGPQFQELWGLELRKRITDVSAREVEPARRMIKDQILPAFKLDVRVPGQRTLGEQGSELFAMRPDARGTELGVIGARAAKLDSWLATTIDKQMANLRGLMDELELDTAFADPVVRRTRENELIEQMRTLNFLAKEQIRATERGIAVQLGREFKFEDFNLDRARSAPFGQNLP